MFQKYYLDYQKYFLPYLEWSVPQPHNIFLAFWLEAGILGLLGFLWLIFLFFKTSIKKTAIHKNEYAIILAAIICILVQGFFEATYWKNDLSAVFWILTGIFINLEYRAGRLFY
jgi:O-antigen ligase